MRMLVAGVTCVLASSAAYPPHELRRVPIVESPAPPHTGFFRINSLRLQYLDWGGTGLPIMLIPGAGDSPQQFGDLAARLNGQHRVIAIARRGHGQSEVPKRPFTVDDLADDLRQMLDSLHVDKVILVGYSFGGNDATRFAERFPSRVVKLILLDAAFDWSTPEKGDVWLKAPFSENPTPADLASLDAYRRFQQRMWWWAGVPWTPTAERTFRDMVRVTPSGSVWTPVDSVFTSLIAINRAYRRAYRSLRMPVLAFMPNYFVDPQIARDRAAMDSLERWHEKVFRPAQRGTRAQLHRELPNIQIVDLPRTGHGAVPFTNLDLIASRILAFGSK